MAIRLKNYPSVIDPLVNCLELRVGEELRPETFHWETWSRPACAADAWPFALTPDGCHVFGLSAELKDCPIVLCYAANGLLAAVWWQSKDCWERALAPEESTGQVPLYPSVRFVFADDEDSLAFMTVLRRMQTAVRQLDQPDAADAHHLLQLLSRAPCPPRFLPVGLLTEGTTDGNYTLPD